MQECVCSWTVWSRKAPIIHRKWLARLPCPVVHITMHWLYVHCTCMCMFNYAYNIFSISRQAIIMENWILLHFTIFCVLYIPCISKRLSIINYKSLVSKHVFSSKGPSPTSFQLHIIITSSPYNTDVFSVFPWPSGRGVQGIWNYNLSGSREDEKKVSSQFTYYQLRYQQQRTQLLKFIFIVLSIAVL